MKKIISIVLSLSCFLLCFSVSPVNAAGNASIDSGDFEFVSSGEFHIATIKEDIKKLTDGKLTKAEMEDKYGTQLCELDIYISGIKSLNDIYGIQFSINADSDKVALAYFETNLQNSDKIGVSLWEAYMSHKDESYRSARVLMYGTKAVTAAPNDVVNKVTSDKYKIAKLYYLADSSLAEDFKITYTIEDIASKDSSGTVKSIGSEFKEKTECVAKFEENSAKITAKTLGAQIRTKGKQGIRFGTKISKDEYFQECEDVSFGTLIAVTNQLGKEELTLDSDCRILDSRANILEDTEKYICFSGEITDFPENGEYDTVNFTARAYIKYKPPKKSQYKVIYTEPVVRSVSQIKSIIGMK